MTFQATCQADSVVEAVAGVSSFTLPGFRPAVVPTSTAWQLNLGLVEAVQESVGCLPEMRMVVSRTAVAGANV